MDSYIVSITVIGIAALGMAWMPDIAKRTKISYATIYVLIGIVLYSLIPSLPVADPLKQQEYTLRLSELVVIVSLMGSGLKIDQPFSFKSWSIPFRLVIITMILSIAAVTFFGWWAFGFSLASAVLLGAVLAPTDPVLAADVQVGPPLQAQKDNVRFSLTAEAGMNDGMAFPFVWLAITFAFVGTGSSESAILEWFVRDFVYKILAGVVIGILMGRFLAYLVFYLPEKQNFTVIRDGFVAVSATLMVYGITELVHGYGFVAVFVTALALRNYELHHKFHKKLHDFTDQIERILLAIVLILFGGSLVSGILDSLTWKMAGFGVGFVFIIRPLCGLLGLIGTRLHVKEKLAVSFFGIRGIGSIYYLTFALTETRFTSAPEIWSMVAFIVLLSLCIHGLTATSVMTKIEEQFSETDVEMEKKIQENS
jgi:NhaP-type Na+/H+ or K+/H+ antiporter